MPVAVVVERRVCAVVEPHQGAICPFRRPAGVPVSERAAHAFGLLASQQPYDVDLVCRLAEDRATTLAGPQLFGPSGPAKVVSEIQRVNHAHGAKSS
ncbi:hypothetical protein D3C72_1247090 [compost metagenome]